MGAKQAFRWTVGGINVDPYGCVCVEPPDGNCGKNYGSLQNNVMLPNELVAELQAEIDKLKEEARLAKEREAESDARLEWYQTEREAQEKRIEGLTALNRRTHDDLQAVCHDRRALREERDNLKEENRRLKHENDSYSRIFGVGDIVEIPPPMKPSGYGYVSPPRVEIKGDVKTGAIVGSIDELVADGILNPHLSLRTAAPLKCPDPWNADAINQALGIISALVAKLPPRSE